MCVLNNNSQKLFCFLETTIAVPWGRGGGEACEGNTASVHLNRFYL